MAHYAFLDENNIVTEVITGIDETELIEGLTPEEWYGNFRGQRCVRTSYNGNIRKNYAGIGHVYDEQRDAFMVKQPFESWILNEDTCKWEPPVEIPIGAEAYTYNEVAAYTCSNGTRYQWDEATISWTEIKYDN